MLLSAIVIYYYHYYLIDCFSTTYTVLIVNSLEVVIFSFASEHNYNSLLYIDEDISQLCTICNVLVLFLCILHFTKNALNTTIKLYLNSQTSYTYKVY